MPTHGVWRNMHTIQHTVQTVRHTMRPSVPNFFEKNQKMSAEPKKGQKKLKLKLKNFSQISSSARCVQCAARCARRARCAAQCAAWCALCSARCARCAARFERLRGTVCGTVRSTICTVRGTVCMVCRTPCVGIPICMQPPPELRHPLPHIQHTPILVRRPGPARSGPRPPRSRSSATSSPCASGDPDPPFHRTSRFVRKPLGGGGTIICRHWHWHWPGVAQCQCLWY